MRGPISNFHCNAKQIRLQKSMRYGKILQWDLGFLAHYFPKLCSQTSFHDIMFSFRVVWHHFLTALFFSCKNHSKCFCTRFRKICSSYAKSAGKWKGSSLRPFVVWKSSEDFPYSTVRAEVLSWSIWTLQFVQTWSTLFSRICSKCRSVNRIHYETCALGQEII